MKNNMTQWMNLTFVMCEKSGAILLVLVGPHDRQAVRQNTERLENF